MHYATLDVLGNEKLEAPANHVSVLRPVSLRQRPRSCAENSYYAIPMVLWTHGAQLLGTALAAATSTDAVVMKREQAIAQSCDVLYLHP